MPDQITGPWAFAAVVVSAVIAPLILHLLNQHAQKPKLRRIEANTQAVGNGFPDELRHLLRDIGSDVKQLRADTAYQRGRLDEYIVQHRAEHDKPG